jgi:hypothetical protein
MSWFSDVTANNERLVLKFYYHTISEPKEAKGSCSYLRNPASCNYYCGILEEFLRVNRDIMISYYYYSFNP